MAAPHFISDLDQAKRAARQHAMAARAGQDPLACGKALGEHLLQSCPPPAGSVVAGFWPIGEEIDIRPLLATLHECGHPIVLPVTPKRGFPLTFRRWRPGDTLVAERFGTFRPEGEPMVPSFLLVPLLAFDQRCHRLGYGAGYYDRTLAGLPAHFAIGCAFAAQQVDAVPIGLHDVRLDAVATEQGVLFPADNCSLDQGSQNQRPPGQCPKDH